jgi:hypothetical protein
MKDDEAEARAITAHPKKPHPARFARTHQSIWRY